VNGLRRKLTDDIVEGILLGPKHRAIVATGRLEVRSSKTGERPKISNRCTIWHLDAEA
jgi:hypothetical protein